jgi:hypothetical protein
VLNGVKQLVPLGGTANRFYTVSFVKRLDTSSPYRKYYIKYWQDRISLYSDKIIRNNGQK